MRPDRKLAIVIPCFNEEEVLPETLRRMTALLDRLHASGKIAAGSRLVFVDDGSSDSTWSLIEKFAAEHGCVTGIKLSRNRGHQNALIAGLFTAQGDMLVSIDADLQDDANVIEEMVDEFNGGADIVYGVRKARAGDSKFKRLTAHAFYRLMHWLGTDSIFDHADFRLMSRRAIEALKQYRETNLYLRGVVPLMGFNRAIVNYDRAERFAGKSKYPLRRMIGLALDAITSFSVVPLRIVAFLGFAVFLGSIVVTLWVVWVRLFTNDAVPGWASIVLPMYFLGGVQIFCIGILGEYMGKIYAEVKARPRFFIDKVLN